MPGIILGAKFQVHECFLGSQYEALLDPPYHVYLTASNPPWG